MGHELFASPLNCTLQSYCSVFEDTDAFFGSSGSFFKFCNSVMRQQGGSYECNPPFEEHLMRRAVRTVENALEECTAALSVALVIPYWLDSEAAAAAQGCRFCRGVLIIAGEQHTYLHGRQHCCPSRRQLVRFKEGRGSLVVMLQNDTGALRWAVTPEILERHCQSWGAQEK